MCRSALSALMSVIEHIGCDMGGWPSIAVGQRHYLLVLALLAEGPVQERCHLTPGYRAAGTEPVVRRRIASPRDTGGPELADI